MRLMILALAASLFAGPALAEPMRVGIDQSVRMRLPAEARDVLLGNPSVADVTMLDGRNLAVVGKAFGATHLLVIDRSGRTIVDRQLVVAAPDQGQVSLYRGPKGEAYACASSCEPVKPR